MELRVFGPMEACGPSGQILLTRAKERAVLAALALFRGRPVSRDQLVDALWADGPPAHPEKALQVYVQRVRATLGAAVVETHAPGYALAPGIVIDAVLFETEANGDGSAPRLRAALGRWTGEPYVDLGEWGPAQLERTRLAALRDHALETCLALEIEAGAAASCIAELEAMVQDQPLRERRWFLLMTALSRDGRVADALRAYQRARKVFATELGTDPGPELQALEEEILMADLRSALSGNLPRQLTSFVGREREMAQLVGHLHEHSLISLIGAGGVGKTRLALEVAAEVVAEFSDGAWLCELAPLTDSDAVWNALAATLNVSPARGQKLDELVLDYLASRHLLLVLDNCEHVLAAVAEVVRAIGQRCTRVAVLVTSRESLAVVGEHVVAVPSLEVPEAGAAKGTLCGAGAVRLFCDRAHDADRNFVFGEHNSAEVAELCRRLDGLPLAIELAAARVRSLAPDDLVARLDQRFKLLTRGSGTSFERHQTLRTTIDWSYDLLTDQERAAFNQLSIFAGGFDLVAVEAVLGDDHLHDEDAARLLGQLVDKSLVVADHHAHGTRYGLLETIRQYAQERLERTGETDAVGRRHMRHYVGVAETAAPHLRSRDQLSTAAGLAPDMDNLREAFDYAVESSQYDPALRLVVALAVTGLPIGWTAMGWAHTASAIPGATQHQLFPLVVALAAIDAGMNGQLEGAASLVEAAEAVQVALGTNHLEVHVARASLALFRGESERARHDAERCLQHARATGEPYAIVATLMLLAAALSGEPARGLVAAEEAVRLARDEGLVSLLGLALMTYGSYVGGEDPALDLALHEELIGVATALGDQQLLVAAVASRESMRARQGDWPSVLRAYADATAQFIDARYAVDAFYSAALAFISLEHFEPGAVILGFAHAHFVRMGNEEFKRILTTADQALLRALGRDRVSELKGRGSALDLPDVVAYLRIEADRALSEAPEPGGPT